MYASVFVCVHMHAYTTQYFMLFSGNDSKTDNIGGGAGGTISVTSNDLTVTGEHEVTTQSLNIVISSLDLLKF